MRILLATFGSFGDLNPILGLAHELKRRGHAPRIATSPFYRSLIERAGVGFHPIRPDVNPTDAGLIARVMHASRGPEVIFKELVYSDIRATYEDTLAAARNADLLVSHPVTVTVPVVSELLNLPWASIVLSPMSFFSIYDLPVFPPMPRVVHLRNIPGLSRLLLATARRVTRNWSNPLYELRSSLGLPRGGDPIYEGQFSPHLSLAAFSSVLASPQPDWPPNTIVTGAIHYDQSDLSPMPAELTAFLDAGPAPLVFTLGSSAVGAPGRFYEESIEAALRLRCRAVLVVGSQSINRISSRISDGILAIERAPFSQLFPRAAAIIHQGGIGTTTQALHAGRPMLVVPHAHDQPDNAFRATNLGVAKTLFPQRYTASRAAAALHTLLNDSSYARRSAAVARQVQQEDGAKAAADALESLHNRRHL